MSHSRLSHENQYYRWLAYEATINQCDYTIETCLAYCRAQLHFEAVENMVQSRGFLLQSI